MKNDHEHPCNGVCKSCKKPVVWATMVPSGTPMPIDPDLEEGGNVELRSSNTGKLFAKVTGPDPDKKKHVSHFSSCEQAAQWRRRKS